MARRAWSGWVLVAVVISAGGGSASRLGQAADRAPWFDPNPADARAWTVRVPITVKETRGVGCEEEPVIVRLCDVFGYRFDYRGLNLDSLRVVDPATQTVVPALLRKAAAHTGSTNDDELIFRVSVAAKATRTLFVYCAAGARIPEVPAAKSLDLNLAPNPSFERLGEDGQPKGWTAFVRDGGRAEIASDVAFDGTRSVLAAGDERAVAGWRSDPIAAQPNRAYEVLVSLKTTPEFGSPKVKVHGLDADRKPIALVVDGYGQTSPEWRIFNPNHVRRVGRTGSDVRFVQIELLKYIHRKGTVWFDRVVLRPRSDMGVSAGAVEHAIQVSAPKPEHWVQPGEALTVVVDASALTAARPSERVSAQLLDPAGKLAGPERRLRHDAAAGDGVWSLADGHRLAQDAAAGRWSVRVVVTDRQGGRHERAVPFMVVADRAARHPGLAVSPDEVALLRQRLSQGKWRERGERLRAHAGAILASKQWYTEVQCREGSLGTTSLYIARNGRIAAALAHGWLVDPRPEIAELAKQRMLEFCAYRHWVSLHYVRRGGHTALATGSAAMSMAIAYDLLQPTMSESEAALVRRGLIDRAIRPAYRDYVIANQRPDGRSNWVGVVVGGAVMAALAMWGDDAELQPELEFYFDGLKRKLRRTIDQVGRDGGWGEGVGYLNYGFARMLPIMEALRRVAGENWHTHPRWRQVQYFLLYALSPAGDGYADFSDSPYRAAFTGAYDMAHYLNQPYLAWIAQVQRQRPDSLGRPSWREMLGHPQPVEPRSPQGRLPTSRLFRDIGWAVMRTGWRPDDAMLVLQSSPQYWPHKHPDQNSFTLEALGERLIVDGGHPDSYSNPKYATWYRASVAHNLVLVDGEGQSYSSAYADGGIVHFLGSPFHDEAVAETAKPYEGRLKTFRRHMVFVKPSYVVLFDEVVPAKPESTLTWLFHAMGDKSISVDAAAGRATIARPKAKLDVAFLSPERPAFEIKPGEPLLRYPTRKQTTPSCYLTVGAAGPQRLLAVLQPLRPDQGARSVQRLSGPGCMAVRVGGKAWTDLVAFGWTERGVRLPGVETDGAGCAVRRGGDGAVQRLAMRGGTRLQVDGRVRFAADARCSACIELGDREARGSAHMTAPGRVQVLLPFEPKAALVDGQPAECEYDGRSRLATLHLPAGAHKVALKGLTSR